MKLLQVGWTYIIAPPDGRVIRAADDLASVALEPRREFESVAEVVDTLGQCRGFAIVPHFFAVHIRPSLA